MTMAPALNCGIIRNVMNTRIASEAAMPTRWSPNRASNKSGTVIAPVRREMCANRFPKTAKPVIGTTM